LAQGQNSSQTHGLNSNFCSQIRNWPLYSIFAWAKTQDLRVKESKEEANFTVLHFEHRIYDKSLFA
jgi:fructose-bisphosphate aldolase class 1